MDTQVINHEITLETLETATHPHFAKVVKDHWDRHCDRGYGSPQITIDHVEIAETDGTSNHCINVMISFQGNAVVYYYQSSIHAPGEYNFMHLTGENIEWLAAAKQRHWDEIPVRKAGN